MNNNKSYKIRKANKTRVKWGTFFELRVFSGTRKIPKDGNEFLPRILTSRIRKGPKMEERSPSVHFPFNVEATVCAKCRF